MHFLKQSTAVTVKLGPFVDAADGSTAETTLTISQADIRLTKNGGNIAQSNDATGATHDELGYYDVPLDATDTNTLGTLRVIVSESGALPVWSDYMVMPANVWDSLFGADALQVHAVEIANNLITAAAIATGAIDADAIADNAIDAGAIAADAITAAKIADGAIDANTFAAGAITASAIAADAIGASELAADAVAEIADAIWDEARAGHVAAGSFGEYVLADVVKISDDATAANNAELFFDGTGYAGGTTKLDVNVAQISTDSTAADNAEAFFDGTGYAGTNNVIPSVTTVTGNVNGSVGSVAGNVTGSVGSLAAQAKADVNAEVLDVLATDTFAEAGSVPAATSTLKDKINWLFALARNKITQTSATQTLRNDADSGNIATSSVADDGTTATRGEWA